MQINGLRARRLADADAAHALQKGQPHAAWKTVTVTLKPAPNDAPDVASISSAAVRDAVADAYKAFARRSAPAGALDVCLGCCVEAETERQLRLWPLSRLTATHFCEYNGSAKSEQQSADEVGHFVPRMLEVLAAGEDIHHSIEISLDRVGRCPDGAWTGAEQRALDRFAAAYFEHALRVDLHQVRDDPLSLALMFHIGGIAVEPLLDLWLQCEYPRSTAQFVEATYWHFWTGQTYANAFATDHPEFLETVRAWLLHPAHRARFAARLLSPAFQALAADRLATGCSPFSTMVDAVFDSLRQ